MVPNSFGSVAPRGGRRCPEAVRNGTNDPVMTARRGECCGHDVARFWRRRPRSDQGDGLIGSPAGPDPGLAGEVAAFLEGRLLDHFAGAGHTVPAWAVLNRLAHADRPALVRLVDGVGHDRIAHPSSGQPPWLATERIVAVE